jgi:hypothetical protein
MNMMKLRTWGEVASFFTGQRHRDEDGVNRSLKKWTDGEVVIEKLSHGVTLASYTDSEYLPYPICRQAIDDVLDDLTDGIAL